MRTLSEVIEQILEKIPAGDERGSLRVSLESIKRSSVYAAPEMQVNLWDACATVLMDEVGNPVEKWETEVVKIFRGDL